jgi:hypothetical protein
MVLYICECCNFESQLLGNYNRHLKTRKHKINNTFFTEKNDFQKRNEKESKRAKKSQKEPKRAKKSQKEPKKSNENWELNLNCKFCDKSFKTYANKRRHELHRCDLNISLMIKKERDEHKKQLEINNQEKEKLYDYIEKLLEKQGNITNTTINIDKQLNQSNTINLNNYGCEDLSHITDSMKMNFIKLPYSMVQNMIEHVHFNNEKPENKNIALTNKKEKMIKVFKDNKWRYKDKSETLDELIQINYGRLDDYFEKEGNRMSVIHKSRYKNYQDKFDNQDINLMNMIMKDTEMIVLSDNL